jgi:hypothetical protein
LTSSAFAVCGIGVWGILFKFLLTILVLSLSEIFAWVTAIEYAYEQAPKDMKTVVQAVSLLIAGMGSAVAMALTTVSHDPNMVIFYASLASAMAATGLIFYYVFRNMEDLPATEDMGSIVHSTPLQGLGNDVLSHAATRQLHPTLEPAGQKVLSRTEKTDYQHADHAGKLPRKSADDNLRHTCIIDPETSAKRRDPSSQSIKRGQQLHTPTPTSLGPASPTSSLDACEIIDTYSDEKISRSPSVSTSNTDDSSGYDTADEYAPRCPSPVRLPHQS